MECMPTNDWSGPPDVSNLRLFCADIRAVVWLEKSIMHNNINVDARLPALGTEF